MRRDLLGLATRMAAALLIQQGELSLPDIEAMPFIENRADALEVANRLVQTFDVRRTSRRLEGRTGYETYIELVRLPTKALLTSARHPQHAAFKRLTRDLDDGTLPSRID